MPTFGAPLGLLALAGLPLLVGLYFLRRRSAPRTVSALFLWRATEEVNEAGPRWRRLNREASLLLELGAVLLATLFLADVRCAGAPTDARHMVVVLDGSFSLQARAEGSRIADRVKAEAKRWIDGASDGTATVVESGPRPRLVAGPAVSLDLAREAIDAWEPLGPSHDPRAAWSLAREFAGTDARVVFLTDAPPTVERPPEIDLVALGTPRPNVAFIGATRSDDPTTTKVELRVARFGDAPARVPVILLDFEGREVHRSEVALPERGAGLVSLTLPASDVLEARLPADDLPVDDTLRLVPDRRRPMKVRALLPEGSIARQLVERFIASSPELEFGTPPDLAFVGAGTPLPPGWVAVIGTSLAAPDALRSYVGPFFSDRQHPLLDDVRFDGLVWTAGPNPPGRPLVTAGTHTLVAEDGSRLHLNVELARSNVGRSVAWPVLLSNWVSLRRAALPGFARRNVGVGEPVSFAVEGEGRWMLSGPLGARPVASGTVRLEAERVGAWTLQRDEVEIDRLSVLPIDPSESDLTTRGSVREVSPSRDGRTHRSLPDRPLWPLAAALLLLLVDYTLAAPGQRRFGAGR